MNQPHISIHITPQKQQTEYKAAFVSQLGAQQTIAIGNGYNDHLMPQCAGLGIAVMQAEGAAYAALAHANIVFPTLRDALKCLQCPKRIIATLRR